MRRSTYISIFYIVGKDEISKEFLQLLEKKASSGVEVKLSVDRIGGYKGLKKRQFVNYKATVSSLRLVKNPN